MESEFAAKLHKDFDGAIHMLEQVHLEGEYLPSLTFCLVLKEEGWPALAASYLNRLQGIFPEEAATSYELALLKVSDSPEEAKAFLRKALGLRPDFVNAFRLLASLFLRENRENEVLALLDSKECVIPTSEKDQIVQIYTYLQYLSKPIHPNSAMQDPLNYAPDFSASLSEVFQRILESIRKRTPFALVRFGDGEGALCSFDTDEELINYAFYSANRQYFSQRWFGRDYATIRGPLQNFLSEMVSLLPSADVVAGPNTEWIRHEFSNGNMRTFASCVNAARMVNLHLRPHQLATRTSIHFDLFGSGALAELVKTAGSICLVTCHRGAAGFFRTNFPSLTNIQLLHVPPPHSAESSVANAKRVAYEVVDDVVEMAKTLDPRFVFLVGAGFAGKLICLRLKALGFVALDIGSIFDLLMGLNSRPNFSLYAGRVDFNETCTFSLSANQSKDDGGDKS